MRSNTQPQQVRRANQHGTYDAKGNFHPQQVHLGQTTSGKKGFFTGHVLAWPLSDLEFERCKADELVAAGLAFRLGFDYVPWVG